MTACLPIKHRIWNCGRSILAELHLIRHGQASFEAADYDCLSAVGVQQSRWLGAHLAEQGRQFDRLYTGSLQRHHQTAHALLEGLGCSVPIEEHSGLNEYDFRALLQIAKTQGAVLPDMPRGDRKAFFQALRQVLILWSQDRLPSAPETWSAFQRRVADARAHIQASGARSVLAVSSGGAMAVMAQQVLSTPDATAIDLNLQLVNSGVCRYFFNAQVCRLAGFNAAPHLERPDRQAFLTYA